MAMDLDKDYTVNGHTFKAGKGVDVTANDADSDGKITKTDYSQAIKDMQKAETDSEEFGGHTHGVPTMEDPLTPTSGTPTRDKGEGKVVSDPIPEEEK